MRRYIHQLADWPNFFWDQAKLAPLLASVRHQQGRLLGQMEGLGFLFETETVLETLTLDVLKSSEIEGEFLDKQEVRSSVARHLGVDIGALVPADSHVKGMVEMVLDATQNYNAPLTADRLCRWHLELLSADYRINMKVGTWRDDAYGPMQVVSGFIGRERVHYEAPPAKRLDMEMDAFINWVNRTDEIDPILKAAVAHLWFVTIHPFDDGNGRIARAIADMLLAQSEQNPQRFYSTSAQIRVERKGYYHILEKTQKGKLDITAWLEWFLNCLSNAFSKAEQTLSSVLRKAHFWKMHADTVFNDRQKLMLNKLFDGFKGKLTSSKWAKIAKCSQDTALRDIQMLIEEDILEKAPAGGRSTSYSLKE